MYHVKRAGRRSDGKGSQRRSVTSIRVTATRIYGYCTSSRRKGGASLHCVGFMPAPEHAGGRIFGDQPPLRSPDSDSGTSRPAHGWDRPAPSWILIGILACAVLGIVSVLTLPS